MTVVATETSVQCSLKPLSFSFPPICVWTVPLHASSFHLARLLLTIPLGWRPACGAQRGRHGTAQEPESMVVLWLAAIPSMPFFSHATQPLRCSAIICLSYPGRARGPCAFPMEPNAHDGAVWLRHNCSAETQMFCRYLKRFIKEDYCFLDLYTASGAL